jgi:hypothetical protein
MTGPTPFPEDVLQEIGRVTVAATSLEFMLAEFAASVLPGTSADEIMCRPGQAVRAARQAAGLLDLDLAASFGAWVARAKAVLEERHQIVHSVWMMRAAAPGVGEYFGRHPRTRAESASDPAKLQEVASRIDSCTNDGFQLIFDNAPRLRPVEPVPTSDDRSEA